MTKHTRAGYIFDSEELKVQNCQCLPIQLKEVLADCIVTQMATWRDKIKVHENILLQLKAFGAGDVKTEECEFNPVKFAQELFPEESDAELTARMVKSEKGIIKHWEQEWALFDKARETLKAIPACPGTKPSYGPVVD